MRLRDDYYHCFMGNGLDAVLIGESGSMTARKVGVDRCAWYKSDRYYPEHKLAQAAGRWPVDRPLEHAEGSGWFELAPIGRTWVEVWVDGQRLEQDHSEQSFDPRSGVLATRAGFGEVTARVTTFLHAEKSLLVEHYEFSQPVTLRAWMAPGVWVEEGWDSDPFLHVEMDRERATGWYDLGETQGNFFLQVDPAPRPQSLRIDGLARGVETRGQVFTKYFSIVDQRQGSILWDEFEQSVAGGYAALFDEHTRFWQSYAARSSVRIPDEQFQMCYDASLYHFKAAQNRQSGGLPVNNLRRTWSSHLFWDSYFVQQALLEANHLEEGLGACRFLRRTEPQARRHAREEFGCPGLKWDWEITHDGRKAYGALLHMKFQAHNNGSYANEIWNYYRFTQDRAYLEEYWPILEGLALFFMNGIVLQTERGWEIGPLVGVHESPVKVKNEGTSLAAAIVIFERFAEASAILGRANEFSASCLTAARGLRDRLDTLYNGKFFVSAEGADNLNMSSLAVIYPLQVIPFRDPRSVSSLRAFIEDDREEQLTLGEYYNFPWAWGLKALIAARQGDGDAAWEIIQQTRPTICQFGGMTEVMQGQEWNMQYFGTAQAAVVSAIHGLLLQAEDDRVRVFPALPRDWRECAFERLLAGGLEVSGAYHDGQVSGTARNITPGPLTRWLEVGGQERQITLAAGELYEF